MVKKMSVKQKKNSFIKFIDRHEMYFWRRKSERSDIQIIGGSSNFVPSFLQKLPIFAKGTTYSPSSVTCTITNMRSAK